MRFSYKFSNLLGCSHRHGNVEFTAKGDQLASLAGNCVTIFDLKKNITRTLPFETSFNIVRIAFSPNGRLAMAATDSKFCNFAILTNHVFNQFHC